MALLSSHSGSWFLQITAKQHFWMTEKKNFHKLEKQKKMFWHLTKCLL